MRSIILVGGSEGEKNLEIFTIYFVRIKKKISFFGFVSQI